MCTVFLVTAESYLHVLALEGIELEGERCSYVTFNFRGKIPKAENSPSCACFFLNVEVDCLFSSMKCAKRVMEISCIISDIGHLAYLLYDHFKINTFSPTQTARL